MSPTTWRKLGGYLLQGVALTIFIEIGERGGLYSLKALVAGFVGCFVLEMARDVIDV